MQKLKVQVSTKHYEAEELTLVANVRGKTALINALF